MPADPLIGDIASAASDLRELCERWLNANDQKHDKNCDVCQAVRELYFDLGIIEEIDEW